VASRDRPRKEAKKEAQDKSGQPKLTSLSSRRHPGGADPEGAQAAAVDEDETAEG
jgi:hypothetical protein